MIQSICLLGSFRIYATSPIGIPRKGKALLALLAIAALDGEGMTRERLATMLWPYQDSERCRHSLRNCLGELRKVLRTDAVKILITDFTSCRADMPTDVAEFARLERSNNQHDLELAAELYRGDLLDDDLYIASEPFDEWLQNERDLWRHRAIAVLSRLSTIATANADHGVSIRAARRLVHIDSLNEESHRLLMGSLYAGGQHGEVGQQYRRCRQTLKEELGIEPAPETSDLAARLLAVNRRPDPLEALRLDREVMAKLLSRLEQIIDTKHVGMKSLERMRDAIKHRLGQENLAPAPRPRPQSNGEVGVELRI